MVCVKVNAGVIVYVMVNVGVIVSVGVGVLIGVITPQCITSPLNKAMNINPEIFL